jgi:phosphoribosylformylglycinamidine synthase subunit PurQ / glutaminase
MTFSKPRALILHADGTNRDHEAAQAFELAGAKAEIVPLNQLRTGQRQWRDYQLLALPGGFSYADALGAGRLLALDLRVYFADEVRAFVDSGKPVIGICNGFQALVKAGLLPALETGRPTPAATLTFNASGHFECRWVTLRAQSQVCLWTRGLAELIDCPVAHGEGRFVLADPADLARLQAQDQIALTYATADGAPARGAYPRNPNGSPADIAGVCNPAGNVLGLMPHPEDHLLAYQHPGRARGQVGRLGRELFVRGVTYAAQL